MTDNVFNEVIRASQEALSSVIAWQNTLPLSWLSWFQTNRVVLTGVGKSFDVARLGASLFQSVGMTAIAISATDLLHGGFGVFPANSRSTLVMITHSGRTAEVLEVARHARELRVSSRREIETVMITGRMASNLVAPHADHVLRYICPVDGSRHGTIPSVSTTAQLAWLNLIACCEADVQSRDELALNHPAGNLASVYERMPSE